MRSAMTASDWMEAYVRHRYLVDQEQALLGRGDPGGRRVARRSGWIPSREQVEGYWGGDRVNGTSSDNMGLDDYCEEIYG